MVDAVDDPVEVWRPDAVRGAASGAGRALRQAEAVIVQLRAALIEAENRAETDPLTGLLNRRGFDRALARVIAERRRYGGEAALIYLDLDGFKAINDRHGHAAGDGALAAVARLLRYEVRESDVVARLGGDEFAVVLNHAGRAIANAKARSLAAALERAYIGPGAPIRFSWGVRTFEPGLAAEQMVAEADAAMFVRKGAR